MKKLLIVLAIGAFAACNSGSDTTTTDSTAVDSSSMAPMTDTSSMMTDTSNMMMGGDTTHTDTTQH
jgi:hypothetical protein